MNRGSFIWLLVLLGIALLGMYHALGPFVGAFSFVRFLGLTAFGILCVSLIMGPLAVFWPKEFAPIVESRRAMGLAAFVFMLVHFILALDVEFKFNFGFVLSNPALLIGVVAFVIGLGLAITSNDWAVRSVPNWKNIQRLAYLIFALAFVHFLLKSNGLFTGKEVNAAELAMVVLGLVTGGVQIAGYSTVKGRQAIARNAAQTVQPKPEEVK